MLLDLLLRMHCIELILLEMTLNKSSFAACRTADTSSPIPRFQVFCEVYSLCETYVQQSCTASHVGEKVSDGFDSGVPLKLPVFRLVTHLSRALAWSSCHMASCDDKAQNELTWACTHSSPCPLLDDTSLWTRKTPENCTDCDLRFVLL